MIASILALALFQATGLYDPSQANKKVSQIDESSFNAFLPVSFATGSAILVDPDPCGLGFLNKDDGLCHFALTFDDSFEDLKCAQTDRKVECTWKVKGD